MSEQLTSTFLITLAGYDSKAVLKENQIKPTQSNLRPLEIRIRRSANKKDPNAQKCKYISSKETEYSENTRCYIQIWELDNWTIETKKKGKKVKDAGKEQDSASGQTDQAKQNDFLGEIGGFIKEVKKGKEYKFISDGKGTAIPQPPKDKNLGKLIFKIDHLDKENIIEKKDVVIPIQGEAEDILEIGIVYQDSPNQKSYTDNYSRPVYHIRNISKIIQDQIDEGGLRMICFTEYNRNIEKADLKFYRENRMNKKLTGSKKIPQVTDDIKANLKDWLTALKKDKKYDGAIPVKSSPLSIYKIANDSNFPDASGNLAKNVNSLYSNNKDEIVVGRFVIYDWREIATNVSKLIDSIYEQHMESKGEKPKVNKLGIYCHGEPNMLLTAGRLPEQTGTEKKARGNLKLDKVTEFVKSFTVQEDGKERKFLTDNAVIALYACSAARSAYTDEGVDKKKRQPKVDNTFGKKPPAGRKLGESSIARALRDALQANNAFTKACVYGHTTVGDADANPHVRYFCSQKEDDLTNLNSEDREIRRNKMFTYPSGV